MTTPTRTLVFCTAVGLAGLSAVTQLPQAPVKPTEVVRSNAGDPVEPTFPIGADAAKATTTAVTPKVASDSVRRGIAYLVGQQQTDGGWNQGGGWRTNGMNQGRVEGKNVADPSDLGNTCIALLALVRAGNTASEGEHRSAVKLGLSFVYGAIEQSKGDDLYVTDVRNTQLQSKIGPYVDTFLANLLLAELKGKSGSDDHRLLACLDKTMNKIVKHQTDAGQYANNGGWAPVLSVAIANKGMARARQNGAAVDDRFFARAGQQSTLAVNGAATLPADLTAAASVDSASRTLTLSTAETASFEPTSFTGRPYSTGGSIKAAFGGGGVGDAGVSLYRVSQGAGNSQDVVNALAVDEKAAKAVVADINAGKEQKAEAERKIVALNTAMTQNSANLTALSANVRNERFVAGFGSNGGEEFLSFLNISETLVLKGGKEWDEWDNRMQKAAERTQDKDGSWSGQHCITGKTFCTAGALLVLMADRTPFPAEVIRKAREGAK